MGHIAHWEEGGGAYRVLVGDLRESGYLEDPGMLKGGSSRNGMGSGTGLI